MWIEGTYDAEDFDDGVEAATSTVGAIVKPATAVELARLSGAASQRGPLPPEESRSVESLACSSRITRSPPAS